MVHFRPRALFAACRYGFIAACASIALLLPNPLFAAAETANGLIVNGVQLSQEVADALDAKYGKTPPGRYWYDPVSGLVGAEGGPSAGQIHPGLKLGGPLAADASGGGTGVFINGREIHPNELRYLNGIYGRVAPGRYWLNARFVGGQEGGPASFDLGKDTGRAAGSTIRSRDGRSSLITGRDGCTYFSSGGISASTC